MKTVDGELTAVGERLVHEIRADHRRAGREPNGDRAPRRGVLLLHLTPVGEERDLRRRDVGDARAAIEPYGHPDPGAGAALSEEGR